MISAGSLKTISNKQQTTELNVRREYIQHLFLSYFYQQPNTHEVFFKGGTALRIIYSSPRFSEDLDFSSSSSDIKQIEDAVLDTLQEVEREGIHTEITESKITSGGYLAIILFDLVDQRISLHLEISLREGEKKGELTTIASDFIPPYTIMSLSTEQLVGEKIQALLTRQKPRDFYDLYFILRANVLTQKERAILPKVLQTLKKSDIQFESELKQFLPKSHWAVIRDFKSILERELQRFI
ncbi:MAG: hypothetical protein COU66_02120 [Candidatus Pacebacteria bacterium CG10_big_fil_rev_8_21_14_0_10_44_11]|nr:MAG: hypothetical protein COU66_02120 [Candidatus Pacebacteria bacterium CG10_big_fil_rev_8_21_14_0_10_44_11]